MDLKELQEKGGFVPQTTVQKSVSWIYVDDKGNENKHTGIVRVKKHSAGSIERMWKVGERAKDPANVATLISQSIYADKGDEPLFTHRQAFDLLPSLAAALVDAIDEVNPQRKATVDNAKN